jgi:hypothetical protein
LKNPFKKIDIMNFNKMFISMFVALVTFSYSFGQVPSENIPNPNAITTFECAGLYWKTPEDGACKIRYKEAKSNAWKEGLELVYDSRDNEYRGSIIGLIPNTEYQAELTSSSAKSHLKFKTRNDHFTIGETTILQPGETDKTIVITESGTPEAYHLITVPENSKSVLNMKNVENYGIEIDADYVIVRGVEIRNAAIHGILIKNNRHDIVIEQCHITFWGRMGGPFTYGNFDGNMDSGIYADDGTMNLTIQRNLIEDPRGASNDWETGHPTGPQGISINQSKGGNVIRYNDIVSTEDHGYNDGIGGSENFSFIGNMNRDSDIHGNIIRSVWDDAIECEGANMNVRIWGNYTHLYYHAVATASTSRGPLYIFRNVLGESRVGHRNTMGGSFIKTAGERGEFKGGRRYLFHNTILQPRGVYDIIGRSYNCISRNNIYDTPGKIPSDVKNEPPNDYDYDYYSGLSEGSGQGKNSARATTTLSGTILYISIRFSF